MNEKYKRATAHVTCEKKFGTAFLVSPNHAITAYHVVSRYVTGSTILLEFPYLGNEQREAKLLNARKVTERRGVDLAVLELDKPILDLEPLKLTIRELSDDLPWAAFGYPATKDTSGGQQFIGDFSHNVRQNISRYDLDLACKVPNIIDPNFVVQGASGSAVIIQDEVVAILTRKMPGGTLGAVSFNLAKEVLANHTIPFVDKTPLTPGSVSSEISKIHDIYNIKIAYFLENNVKLPFNTCLIKERELVYNSGINHFLEQPTWKEKITQQISDLARRANSSQSPRDTDLVKRLQNILDLSLTYEELRLSLRRTLSTALAELQDDTSNLKQLLLDLFKSINKRFNKVFMISGESGSGKTQLIKSILSLQNFVGLGDYSIKIPLDISDMKTKGIESSIIYSINNFLNTRFNTILDLNEFIENQLKIGVNIRIVLVVDGLQTLLYFSSNFFKDLKKTVIYYTLFDWVSWCLSINDVDQYLVMDKSDFLLDYCFSNSNETDALSLFMSMNELNSQNRVCYDILNSYGMDPNIIEKSPQINISNKMLLLNNPLICHVYGNTTSNIEKELQDICYFSFIKRYSEIKKNQMIDCSQREISREEIDAQIDEETKQVVLKLMDNKKLMYTQVESNVLFQAMDQCYYELRYVQLVNKEVLEIVDDFDSSKVSVKSSPPSQASIGVR